MLREKRISFKEARYGGLQVAYYLICRRKLWLYSNYITQEHTSQQVAIGQLVDEESLKRKKKHYLIDNLINIDILEGGTIHETKLSSSMERASRFQLLYYIYYLQKKGVEVDHGVLHYPEERKKEKVYLTDEARDELLDILAAMEDILSQPMPPEAERRGLCRPCSYEEFCWG